MKKVVLHPFPVRLWHWINAFCFLVLIVTGVQLRYRELVLIMPFRTAVNIHNFFGFFLAGNYCIWFVYYFFTGKIKLYIPDFNVKKFLMSTLKQAKYYGYGIFVGDENPHHPTPDDKFNPLQKSLYLILMVVLIPLQIISGILLWNIKGYEKFIIMAGGLKVVDTIHVFLSMFFFTFILIHVYLASLGATPLAHVKAMFTGYEECEEEHSH